MKKNIFDANVRQFELLEPLLYSAYKELSELSRKKPDGPLNSFKIKLINKILEPLKNLMIGEDIVSFLDTLDEDSIPTNSDVVLILSHYIDAIHMFRKKYIGK